MKLYFHPFSGNSRRANLTATHLELPVERIVVDLIKGEQKGPAHLARNPNGTVPVLEDGDFTLWESRAIMQYFCDKTPGQTLLPSEPRGRADVNRWMFWDTAHLQPAAAVYMFENVVKGFRGMPADAHELERGEKLFRAAAPVLDKHLEDKEWVSGGQLSLADYSLAASFGMAGRAKMPIADYPNFAKWLARVQELDAWKKTAA